jgi:hypothetical protein
MRSLGTYRRNVHSQNGEDGVIEEIVKRLGIRTGSFVEFGAWDGRYLSNCLNLLEKGWTGVFIEGDAGRFEDLVRNMKPFASRVELINAWVEPTGSNRLDRLLASTRLRPEFELLSIDIDSTDFQVWESLVEYRPAIVVIEINSSIPAGVRQTHQGPEVQGSSFTSTLELGRRKGYTTVCHTGNLFLVRDDLVGPLRIPGAHISDPGRLFDDSWIFGEGRRSLPHRVRRVFRRIRNRLGV